MEKITDLKVFYQEYKHNLLLMFNDVSRYPICDMTNDHILRYYLLLERDLKHFITGREEFLEIESHKEIKQVLCPLVRKFKQDYKKDRVKIGQLKNKTNSYRRLNRLVNQLNTSFLVKPILQVI